MLGCTELVGCVSTLGRPYACSRCRTLVGTPAAIWGLYVIAGITHLEQHFESDHWSPHSFPRALKILRNLSAGLFFPLFLPLFLIAVVTLQPLFLLLWAVPLLLYALARMMCVRDRRAFLSAFAASFRDAIDLCILMAVRALFPWLHSTPADDGNNAIDVVQNQCAHAMRVLVAAGYVIVLQVILPIFGTVTDVLFLLEMIDRYMAGIPPAAQNYYLSMLCLTGVATAVNLIVHLLWLVLLFRYFWTAYSITNVLWMMAPQYIAPDSYKRRVRQRKIAIKEGKFVENGDDDDDEYGLRKMPWWMPLTVVVKVMFGDVLHIVVLCMTFGFFGSTPSIPWLLNVIAAVVSVGILLGEAFAKLMFSRVIHHPLALAFLQAVATVEFMAAVSAPVLLLLFYPTAMFGSSVCLIPWQAGDLTDDLLTMIASSCATINFDLVIAGTDASTWVFPLLTSAVYIQISNNSHLISVQFPALTTLAYPPSAGFDATAANLAGATQSTLWCAQSILAADTCTGICCSGSGLVIENNPFLTSVSFPHVLGSALFQIGDVVAGDPAYDPIDTYDEDNSLLVANIEVDRVRVVNNPDLASLTLAINSRVFSVEVAHNARLRRASLTLDGLFVTVTSNPSLANLTLAAAATPPAAGFILGSEAADDDLLDRVERYLPTTYMASVERTDGYSHLLEGLWGYTGVVVADNNALTALNMGAWTPPPPAGQVADALAGVVSRTFLVVANNTALRELTLPPANLTETEYLLVSVVGNTNLAEIESSTGRVCNCSVPLTTCVPATRTTATVALSC